jgi:hypothetical protein
MTFRTLGRILTALALGCTLSASWAAVEVQGVALDETVTVGGQQLLLNGAGYRKRGYFKVDVTGVYMPARYTTLEALEKAPGAKRVELAMLQDISGSQASKYFLIDFEASATPQEFAQLINEVSEVGAVYSALPKIKKGDVINLDWIPGKGLISSLNGQIIQVRGAPMNYINNELMARIMVRMYVGGKTPQELRDNLLGLSYTMRDHPPTGTPAAAPATASK